MHASGKPAWLKEGMVFSGCQEALSFMIRRGANLPVDYEQQWERARSEEVLARHRDAGAVLFVLNAHKCFGLVAEKEDIESSVRCAARCRQLGLKVGAYVGETIGYETFFKETPEARDWVARRYDGRQIRWLSQSFRLFPCKFNQGWIDFQKKVVELAVKRIGVDFLHFDNVYVWPEPDSCHCDNCRAKFRAFLARKYAPDQLKRRLGFSSAEGVLPPAFAVEGGGMDPRRISRLRDPLQQEWVDFRCEELASMYAQLCAHARKLKPDIVLECNPVNTCINTAFLRGVDIPRLVKHGHFFWVEDGNAARVEPDGRMISNIRTYKMARALDNGAFAYLNDPNPSLACLRVAEAMAFNLDCIGPLPRTDHPSLRALLRFFRERRELFSGTRIVADAAVLRNFKSLAWESQATHVQVLLAEQTLIQKRIPFRIIFDAQMGGETPVLVLAGVEFMSDAEVAQAADHARNGGGLLVAGSAGLCDEMARRRESSPLLAILGATDPAAARRGTIGRGRFAYIPQLAPRRPLPERRDYQMADNRYWHLPENAAEMAEALGWCLGRRFSLEIAGAGDYLAAELVDSADSRRRIVHAVNYDVARPADRLEVSLEIPPGHKVTNVTVFDPAADASRNVAFAVKDGRAEFVIPRVDIYALAEVKHAAG